MMRGPLPRTEVKDEVNLVDAATKGNKAAFGQLVRKYQDRLFTSLVHLIGSQEEAEDITQEAFVQAFVKLDTFKKNASFYTWLYRIAFNLAMSRQRKARARLSTDVGAEVAGLEPSDPSTLPGDQLLRNERVEQVQQALGQLSENHRQVIILRELEGCDYEAIAEILEISVGTVRSRLHRARELMRQLLERVRP